MREKDSFRRKNLLTKIENLIAKNQAEKDNLPLEEYKLNARYIQGFLAGLEEARRIVKGLPSGGRRESELHQRLKERRKMVKIRTEGEGSRLLPNLNPQSLAMMIPNKKNTCSSSFRTCHLM